jgi:glycyl-tRNA synthetase beta chain
MADFLFELRCEEIPARMQAGARAELEKLFRRELAGAGVAVSALTVWSTPRRLALIARGLPLATEAVSEEAKGPPEGAPDAAIDGFCKKAGVTRDQLELRDVKGRMTYFAVVNIPGRAMADVLAAAIPAIIRDFSWPKSMRWGAASITTDSLRWVRPLSGIVALLDGEVVACEVGGIVSGAATEGHRFHHDGPITIGSADDYAEKLRACHVIVDHEERAAIIREGAASVAAEAGLSLVPDEGLVIENAGLTEWPVPLLGRFDEAFLDVPPEVIQLTARVNQKYFVCEGPDGKLANAFICTANIAARDPAVVVDGNRKVLAARLSDARFFWEQDQKTPLAVHAEKLARVTFFADTSMSEKVQFTARLAYDLSKRCNLGDPALAERGAELAKVDLVTEMVGEFPELQGIMGSYYAAMDGEADEIVHAVRDHYRPRGPQDTVPTSPVTVAVALADKLDTLARYFLAKMVPSGSKDPFAMRRALLGVIRLVEANDIRFKIEYMFNSAIEPISQYRLEELIKRDIKCCAIGLREDNIMLKRMMNLQLSDAEQEILSDLDDDVVEKSMISASSWLSRVSSLVQDEQDAAVQQFAAFLADRLEVYLESNGIGSVLQSTVARSAPSLPVALKMLKFLQAFLDTEDGANLLAGYKRAANILRKEDWHGIEREIAQTGEEDPLAMVDDPDLAEIVAEQAHAAAALSYTPEPAEKALIDALDAAAPRAAQAVEDERFADAMAALATLRAPIDRFFEEVTVNAEDADKRGARLALLARFRDAVHRVADFSRIEG